MADDAADTTELSYVAELQRYKHGVQIFEAAYIKNFMARIPLGNSGPWILIRVPKDSTL